MKELRSRIDKMSEAELKTAIKNYVDGTAHSEKSKLGKYLGVDIAPRHKPHKKIQLPYGTMITEPQLKNLLDNDYLISSIDQVVNAPIKNGRADITTMLALMGAAKYCAGSKIKKLKNDMATILRIAGFESRTGYIEHLGHRKTAKYWISCESTKYLSPEERAQQTRYLLDKLKKIHLDREDQTNYNLI